MNAKELYDILAKRLPAPAKIETLGLLIKHGPLTITQIGALRNIKSIHLIQGFIVMYHQGLIGFDPPNSSLRTRTHQNTKLFSKISIDEFNAFKKYSDEVKKHKKNLKAERRSKAIRKIESCWVEDCEHNQNKLCYAATISLIKINVSFEGKPIIICRCLEYDHPMNRDYKRRE